MTTSQDGDDLEGISSTPKVASSPVARLGASTGFVYASEILITKTELEEKNRLVYNLQQQVDETK